MRRTLVQEFCSRFFELNFRHLKCCLGLRSYVLKRLEVLFSWRYYNDLCYLNVEGHAKFISSSILDKKCNFWIFILFLKNFIFEQISRNAWKYLKDFLWKSVLLSVWSFDKKWISKVDPTFDVWVDTPHCTPWVQWRV